MMKKTKIICTLGPSSETPEKLEAMLRAGMNVARFNFSHGSHEEHGKRIEAVRAAARKVGKPVALLLDTKGPEIRLGLFKKGAIEMKAGQEFILTARDVEGTDKIASVSYKGLPQEVKAGDHILLSDGLVNLEVQSVVDDDIVTQVLNSGKMSDRKRVAVPGIPIKLPALSETDIKDIEFGISQNMDWIAASFIQRGSDVVSIRKVLEKHGSSIKIMSKVESRTAIDNIDDIIRMSDGVMVARGDLGVEVPAEEVPALQKMVIRKCRQAGKPVVTATQMLESMMNNPRPTRAETSDIANAILDGTDGIMLSGETAGGMYPVEAVETMARVAVYTESQFDPVTHQDTGKDVLSTTEAIGRATVRIAESLGAAAIIASTEGGNTAQMISKYRPKSPIIAVSPHENIVRRLQVNWGVQAIIGEGGETSDDVVENAVSAALEHNLIKGGDLVVLTAGVPASTSGTTNMIRVRLVADVLLRGIGLGKRSAVGNICFGNSQAQLERDFIPGCILVVKGSGPELIPYIKRAGAIISEEAGLTSESAITALSLGIPAIIGADTSALTSGELVTVDCGRGMVLRGEANAR